jgi:hypothetical protein
MANVFAVIVILLAAIGVASTFAFIADGDGPIGDMIEWWRKRRECDHDGPVFKISSDRYGSAADNKIEGAVPQRIIAWHTCKKCSLTYAVERYETVDEFEARQKSVGDRA